MPHNRTTSKKRQGKRSRVAGERATWGGLKPKLLTLSAPALALFLYAAGSWLRVFSPIYPLMHVIALVLFALWVWRAARSAGGFWATGMNRRFALLCALAVVAGSAWGSWASKDVRVWVTPPDYAHMPVAQLDAPAFAGQAVDVLAGSVVHVGTTAGQKLSVQLDAEEEDLKSSSDAQAAVSFEIPSADKEDIRTLIAHRFWRRYGEWRLHIVPDASPEIAWVEPAKITARKTLRLAYEARDDFGVEHVLVHVTPQTAQADQPNEPVDIELAHPAAKEVRGVDYADLTALPWSGQEVSLQLIAVDGAGHKSWSAPQSITLPTRKFKNPLARALIEEREKLLQTPNMPTRSEVANVMAGMARQQALFRGDEAVTLTLRAGAVRLVLGADADTIPATAALLWQTALRLEEGALGRVRNGMEMAERDLSAAMARGAALPGLVSAAIDLDRSLSLYFLALNAERSRSAAPVQEMNWLPVQGRDPLQPEDIRTLIADLAHALADNQIDEAQKRLGDLQSVTENMRTTAPELSPQQDNLAKQIAALRALENGQRQAMTDTEGAQTLPAQTYKEKQARNARFGQILSRQRLLLAALKDWVDEAPSLRMQEAQAVEQAMAGSVEALKTGNLVESRAKQAEALALLENKLLALSEKMRLSFTTTAPTEE